MKITSEPTDKAFHPVDITFTLETQGELDAMGCCFNSGLVTRALEVTSGIKNVGWHTAFQTFKRLGANTEKSLAFNCLLTKE